jgi:hypothetical protein
MHAYPATVVRTYERDEQPLFSCVVFVDFLARVPQPPGGSHVGASGPVHVCMDVEPFDEKHPEKGGWLWAT